MNTTTQQIVAEATNLIAQRYARKIEESGLVATEEAISAAIAANWPKITDEIARVVEATEELMA